MNKMTDVGKVQPSVILDLAPARTKMTDVGQSTTKCHLGKMTKMTDVGKVQPNVILDLAPARTKMTDVPKGQRSVILEK
jgi:hypothetical protein